MRIGGGVSGARQFRLPASTVRAIDLRYLERWAKRRRKPALRQMGVDEIYLGKSQKFLTILRAAATTYMLAGERQQTGAFLDPSILLA